MTTLTTIEDRIAIEWNWLHAFIALHPIVSFAAALCIGFIIGRFI